MMLFKNLRYFASGKTKLTWEVGSRAIAQALFNKLCTNLDFGVVAVDPRGMRLTQLKRNLNMIGFEGDLAQTEKYHLDVISEWQNLYNDMVNGNVKLPGYEKAGPLTFAKVNDVDCNKDQHDKDGRRLQ